MSANNNAIPSSSSSPEGESTDRSLLEKAGLSESEAEPPEESSKDCVVCQNGTVNWVLLPCRHTCLCDGCVRYFQRCPMCRQFVQESFALHSQKEQEKDKLKTLWGCCYNWKVQLPIKMQKCVFLESIITWNAVLTVNDNSILTSRLCGTWMMKLNYSFLFHMVNTGILSVLNIKMHSATEKKINAWPFIS